MEEKNEDFSLYNILKTYKKNKQKSLSEINLREIPVEEQDNYKYYGLKINENIFEQEEIFEKARKEMVQDKEAEIYPKNKNYVYYLDINEEEKISLKIYKDIGEEIPMMEKIKSFNITKEQNQKILLEKILSKNVIEEISKEEEKEKKREEQNVKLLFEEIEKIKSQLKYIKISKATDLEYVYIKEIEGLLIIMKKDLSIIMYPTEIVKSEKQIQNLLIESNLSFLEKKENGNEIIFHSKQQQIESQTEYENRKQHILFNIDSFINKLSRNANSKKEIKQNRYNRGNF